MVMKLLVRDELRIMAGSLNRRTESDAIAVLETGCAITLRLVFADLIGCLDT